MQQIITICCIGSFFECSLKSLERIVKYMWRKHKSVFANI